MSESPNPRRPTGDELNRLLDTLSRRIVRVLERRGLLIVDPAHPSLDVVSDSSLDHLQTASIAYRIAIGPHAGRKALTLYSVRLISPSNSPHYGAQGIRDRLPFQDTHFCRPNRASNAFKATFWSRFD
jgi:hypothetical protein